MKVLALDPGLTTGYCLLEVTPDQQTDGSSKYDVDLVEWGNLDYEDLGESILTDYCKIPGLKVIAEQLAASSLRASKNTLMRVVVFLDKLFPQAEWVTPGAWKTSGIFSRYPPVSKRFFEDRPTPHQKDAYFTGLWYIERNHGFTGDLYA